MQQTLVAVYASRTDAERARDRLVAIGVPAADIRMNEGTEAMAAEPRQRGFLDWLFGAEPPEADRHWYDANLREGRAALCVYLRNEGERARIVDVLEECGPIDVESASATGQETAPGAETGADQVIPVEKEELRVGKRQTETRHRVRAYVVERPVEQQVELTDETVTIERRPAAGASAAGDFKERDIEVVERHEEPVVAKSVGADEEILVRKSSRKRQETVRDTVRETKVEVDQGAAGNKPSKTE